MNIIASQNDLNEALEVDGTVIVHSFVTKSDDHPVPDKIADHYLNIALLSYPGERREAQGVVFSPLSGHFEHFDSIGLAQKDRYTVLRDPSYPNSNLEQQLLDEIKRAPDKFKDKFAGLSLLPVFPTPISEEIADRANMSLLVSPRTGYMSNNKAALRENSDKYGYKVPDGMQFTELNLGDFGSRLNEIYDYVETTINEGTDVWMKYPTGSGGDLVKPIKVNDFKGSSTQNIRAAVYDAIKGFAHSVLMSRFGGHIDEPTDEKVAEIISRGGLVVESGVKPGFENYNAQMVIGKSGRLTPVNFSKQLTSDQGAYMGNLVRPADEYPEGVADKIWEAMRSLGTYLHTEYGANMLFGADILITESGEVMVIDINARPNGSTSQKLLAANLGARYSLNANIVLPFVPKTYGQIIECLGPELLWTPETRKGVIPKMPRPETGVVKVDILTDQPGDYIEETRRRLRSREIKI